MSKINTFKTATLAVTLAFGAASFSAIAASPEEMSNQAPLADEFIKLDTDGNKTLTAIEAAKDKAFQKDNFAQADVNSNGTLDQNEYSTYKSAKQQKVMGVVVEDSVITAKAKAELLATKDLKSLQISVETRKGEVILSGFVDNESAKMKAEQVVAKIEGVKSVKNSLVVKS
jgi:hyperosmotically inducible periplasmic protein